MISSTIRFLAVAALAGTLAAPALADDTAVPKKAPCKVQKANTSVAVHWKAPEGQPVSALKLRLTYPADLVQLPGSGSAPAQQIKNAPAQAIVVVNDRDDAVDVLVSKSGAFDPGTLFSVVFDRCAGADAPAAAAYSCTVLECGSSFGPVQGCSCSVTTP